MHQLPIDSNSRNIINCISLLGESQSPKETAKRFRELKSITNSKSLNELVNRVADVVTPFIKEYDKTQFGNIYTFHRLEKGIEEFDHQFSVLWKENTSFFTRLFLYLFPKSKRTLQVKEERARVQEKVKRMKHAVDGKEEKIRLDAAEVNIRVYKHKKARFIAKFLDDINFQNQSASLIKRFINSQEKNPKIRMQILIDGVNELRKKWVKEDEIVDDTFEIDLIAAMILSSRGYIDPEPLGLFKEWIFSDWKFRGTSMELHKQSRFLNAFNLLAFSSKDETIDQAFITVKK